MKSLSLAVATCLIAMGLTVAADKFNPTDDALNIITKMKVGKYDWPQWGGSPHRNNTPQGENAPQGEYALTVSKVVPRKNQMGLSFISSVRLI